MSERWKCPECGEFVHYDMTLCVCGYDFSIASNEQEDLPVSAFCKSIGESTLSTKESVGNNTSSEITAIQRKSRNKGSEIDQRTVRKLLNKLLGWQKGKIGYRRGILVIIMAIFFCAGHSTVCGLSPLQHTPR